MHNKSKIFDEVSRMIELSEHGSSKKDIIKEKIKNKIIKEDISGDFDFSDLGNEFGNEENPIKQMDGESLSSSEDIPFYFKLALTSDSLSQLQANLLGLEKKNFLKYGDLFTKRVVPGSEGGTESEAIFYKGKTPVYPFASRQEFNDLTSRGRLVLKFKDGFEEESEEGDRVFKWLGGNKSRKDFNLIGMGGNSFKLSPKGNATLNFLARIASGKPRDEKEQMILDTIKSAKSNAINILSTFYQFATQDLAALLSKKVNIKDDPNKLRDIEEAISDALLAISQGSYDVNKNVGPYIITIVLNKLKDTLKKETTYKPDLEKAYDYFTNTLEREGVISVLSKSPASDNHKAMSVEQVNKNFLYKYDNVDDAIDDLQTSSHMKPYNLFSDLQQNLFYSSRKIASSYGDDTVDSPVEEPVFDEASVGEIKNILGDVVEFMTNDVKAYGLSSKHSEKLNASQETLSPEEQTKVLRNKKAAKQNIINFIYNMLLQMGGAEDVGETGKAVFAKDWIGDWNNKMIENLKQKFPEKSEEEIKNSADKYGLLIKGDTQGIYKGLKDYFGGENARTNKTILKNKEAFNKILNLIGTVSPEGTSNDNVDVMLENKIREKIQKILEESFSFVNEEDNMFDDLSAKIDIYSNKFEGTLKTEKYRPDDLKSEIYNILSTGKSDWNLQDNQSKTVNGVYTFIISVLAALYVELSEKEKRNVISYIFVSMFPNSEMSNAAIYLIARASGLDPKKPQNREIIWSSVVEPDKNGFTSIEKALNGFDPSKTNFLNYLINGIKLNIQNIIKGQEYSYREKDAETGKISRKARTNASLDAPMGGDDDSDGVTLLSKLDSPVEDISDERESQRLFIRHLVEFMKERLSKTELSLFKEILNPDVYDSRGQVNNQLLANRLDMNVGAVRTLRNRFGDKFKNFLSTGELRDYAMEKVGIDINKYPKIQNFLKTKEFIIGDYGSESDEDLDVEDDDKFMF